MGNILKIYHLKDEALTDLYKRLNKDLRAMPKKPDGSIDPYGLGLEDNDVDALRHAFISGVYTIEFNDETAELLGRLNEFTTVNSQSTSGLSENMDLWNNAVGRSYGKKAKSWDDLYQKLMQALTTKELIIDLEYKKMRIERIGIKVNDLRFDARDELYLLIDKHYKAMPKNPDGTINPYALGLADNDIDALRHSYVSAVYVLEYGEEKAELLGRLNELITFERDPKMENMDLWNNSVGRKYGKKVKSRNELFDLLLKASWAMNCLIQEAVRYSGKAFEKIPIY